MVPSADRALDPTDLFVISAEIIMAFRIQTAEIGPSVGNERSWGEVQGLLEAPR
jgi:hypothetical protein